MKFKCEFKCVLEDLNNFINQKEKATRPSALGMSDPVLEFLKISKNYK